MESTGVYWKPIYNVLVASCRCGSSISTVCRRRCRAEADVQSDADWIAQLMQYGLLERSFIRKKRSAPLDALSDKSIELTRRWMASSTASQASARSWFHAYKMQLIGLGVLVASRFDLVANRHDDVADQDRRLGGGGQ